MRSASGQRFQLDTAVRRHLTITRNISSKTYSELYLDFPSIAVADPQPITFSHHHIPLRRMRKSPSVNCRTASSSTRIESQLHIYVCCVMHRTLYWTRTGFLFISYKQGVHHFAEYTSICLHFRFMSLCHLPSRYFCHPEKQG